MNIQKGSNALNNSLKKWASLKDLSPLIWLVFIVILLVLMGLPLYWLLVRSFSLPRDGGITWANYAEVFTNDRFRQAILNSIILGTGSSIISVAIGTTMAWAIARTNMPLRGLIRSLLLVAFAIPPFLGGIAWIMLSAPQSGWLNKIFMSLTGAETGPFNIYSMAGAIFVVGLYSYPYVFLLVSSSLELISSELEDAATILGAKPLQMTLRITLPLVLPSILSGAILSFLEAIALFGSPTMILIPAGINVITTEIWQEFAYPPNVELACAFSICMLAFTLLLLWLQRSLLGRKKYTTLTGKVGRKRSIDLGIWRWLILLYCLAIVTLSLLLPILVLLKTSLSQSWGQPLTLDSLTLKWFQDVLFLQPFTSISIENTLLYCGGAAAASIIIATAIAYLVKRKIIPFGRWLEFITMLPVAIPGIVIAVGIFTAYTRPPFVLYGSWAILVVAFTTRFLPVAYSNVGNLIESIDPDLEMVARNLGATQAGAVQKITIPLLKRGLIGSWLLVFMLAARELSSAILLYTDKTQVLSIAIFQLFYEGSFERLAALGIVMLTIIFATVGIAYWILGRDFLVDKN